MVDEEEGTPAGLVVAEQEAMEDIAVQRWRRDAGKAKEEENHHLLEEAVADTVDGEGGNSGSGVLNDAFFITLTSIIKNNILPLSEN